MDFNVLDVGLIAVIVLLVQAIKSVLPSKLWRFLPLLPLLLGFLLAAPTIIATTKMVPPWPVLLWTTFVEGLKLGCAAIATFDVAHKATKPKGAETRAQEVVGQG